MARSKRKIDRYKYEWQTGHQKTYFNSMKKIVSDCENDPQKKQRLADGRCPMCFYRKGGRIGAAVCTFGECAFCDTQLSSGNSCIDITCKPCAVERGICRQCGADINLKIRRKVNLDAKESPNVNDTAD